MKSEDIWYNSVHFLLFIKPKSHEGKTQYCNTNNEKEKIFWLNFYWFDIGFHTLCV